MEADDKQHVKDKPFEAKRGNVIFRAVSSELASQTMQAHLQRAESWARDLERVAYPMSDKLSGCIEDIKTTIIAYLNKKGITDYDWPENLHMFVFKKGQTSSAGGSHIEHSVIFAERFSESDKKSFPKDKADEMEEVFLAVALAEELIHATGGKIFDVTLENEDARGISRLFNTKTGRKIATPVLVKSGLVYPDKIKMKDDVVALEEGLVEDLLDSTQATIWRHYSDEVAMPVFRGLKREIGYSNSITLTSYLKGEIPDFIPLAQKARVNNDDVPFREAIEKTFGNGSFDKVVGATEKTAKKVLNELQRSKT